MVTVPEMGIEHGRGWERKVTSEQGFAEGIWLVRILRKVRSFFSHYRGSREAIVGTRYLGLLTAVGYPLHRQGSGKWIFPGA